MRILERIKAAAGELIPVEDDLDMGGTSRVRNLPAPQDSNDAARLADAGDSTKVFYQDTEPSETPEPSPSGNGGLWFTLGPPGAVDDPFVDLGYGAAYYRTGNATGRISLVEGKSWGEQYVSDGDAWLPPK